MDDLVALFSSEAGLRLLSIGLVFLLAGTVKGVVGLGLPTVAIGLLGLLMSPMQAAAILIVPSFVTNLWQVFSAGHPGPMLKRLRWMLLGIVAGTGLGAVLAVYLRSDWAAIGLGLALIVYSLLGLFAVSWQVAPSGERRLGPLVGAVTGLITSITGVFVVPAVPFLQALGLNRNELVQAMGLAFTVSTIALGASLAASGGLPGTALGESMLALPPALAGMALGQWIRGRMHPLWFKRCFFLGLLAVGVHAVSKAWI